MKASVLTCSLCLDRPHLANSQWCRLCWQAWWIASLLSNVARSAT